MIFRQISKLFQPPKPVKERILYAITTNGERYVVYTRSHHEEIRSLNIGMRNGWRMVHAGVLRTEISSVFEVEKMLNDQRDYNNSEEIESRAIERLEQK